MPSSQGSPARTPARAAALAFLAAGATLFVQVLVHRIVTAKLLNNFAFVVISLTMLGFAASGVLLDPAARPGRARPPPLHSIAGWAGGCVLSLLAASIGLV